MQGKNEIMRFVGECMEPEKIMSNEVTQRKKDKCHNSLSSEAPSFKSSGMSIHLGISARLVK